MDKGTGSEMKSNVKSLVHPTGSVSVFVNLKRCSLDLTVPELWSLLSDKRIDRDPGGTLGGGGSGKYFVTF